MTLPTGEQFELETQTSSGLLRAIIGSVGACIRELTIDGIDLVPTYPDDQAPPAAAGVVLVPWANRVRDGRWSANDTDYQLAITEPALNNAIHGLLRYTDYRVTHSTADEVTLNANVVPQPGYPFLLRTAVHYELVSDGLKVTHFVENLGSAAAPVVIGAHPYLKIGDTPTEELLVQINAASHLNTDERLIPTGEVPVDDHTDLREPRLAGDLQLDDAFGEPITNEDGNHEHTLTSPDGRTVGVWAGSDFAYLQVFTHRSFPNESLAIAIEPMTGAADAFNSERGLRWLDPGEEWQVSWGIRFSGFNHTS